MVQLDHIGQKCFDMAVKVNHFHLEQKKLKVDNDPCRRDNDPPPWEVEFSPFINCSLFMDQGRGSESPSMDVEVNHLHLFQSQN